MEDFQVSFLLREHSCIVKMSRLKDRYRKDPTADTGKSIFLHTYKLNDDISTEKLETFFCS